MTNLKQETMPWKAMHLAIRPQGTTHLDFPRMTVKDHHKSMGRLVSRGVCTRTKIDGTYVYTATLDQLHTYKHPILGKPPAPRPHNPSPPKIHTFCQPRPRAKDSDIAHFKAQDATYPVDADGRPLYKITVAPPPQQPTRTNTHSGAY